MNEKAHTYEYVYLSPVLNIGTGMGSTSIYNISKSESTR